MSRIRVSHQPDGWRDDGPATPQKKAGWAGAMVVGASGHQSIRTDRKRPPKPRKERPVVPQCGHRNTITCARARDHKGHHESREALDNRNATRRLREGGSHDQTTSR